MDDSNDRLIGALVADLRPVRPLLPPALRALIWLMFVAAVAAALAMFADVGAVSRRMTAISDMWLAVLGSIATMATAAFAAFELSLPDRSRAWAFLPLPALACGSERAVLVACEPMCCRAPMSPGSARCGTACCSLSAYPFRCQRRCSSCCGALIRWRPRSRQQWRASLRPRRRPRC